MLYVTNNQNNNWGCLFTLMLISKMSLVVWGTAHCCRSLPLLCGLPAICLLLAGLISVPLFIDYLPPSLLMACSIFVLEFISGEADLITKLHGYEAIFDLQMIALVSDLVCQEISSYSSRADALLSLTSPEQMVTFNYQKMYAGLWNITQTLLKLVEMCCCINTQKRKNVNKTVTIAGTVLKLVEMSCCINTQKSENANKTVTIAGTVFQTIICKILSTRNQRLSRLKYVTSLILKREALMTVV